MKRQIRSSGFTIIELIVSISLVLILMLGVSTVFKTISSTVSAGSAISDNTRLARAAQATFAADFSHFVSDKSAPFISIHASMMPAYRNRADDLSDAKSVQFKLRHQLTIDLNGDNIEGDPNVPGERISAATYNHRNHRTDILTFFVRDLLRRQTGNPGQNMISSMTRAEAWIRYAHAQVWDGVGPLPNAGSFQPPDGNVAANANPNNQYGSQFVLSRTAILLSDGADTNNDGTIDAIDDPSTTPPTAQRFWKRGAGVLSPLATNSAADTGGQLIQESIYDIAGITMDGMRTVVNTYLATATPAQKNTFGSQLRWRPCVNPYMPKPLNSQTLAQTVPVFVPGCTQFIVEYAGDFLKQDNVPTNATYGNVLAVCAPINPAVTPAATDGVIDYLVVNGAKQIRWYGLPRDTNSDGIISGWAAGKTSNQMPDVVPLRDVMRTLASEVTSNGAPFEKNQPFITPKTNYADTSGGGNNGLGISDEYNCVWTQSDTFRPRMIRITMVLDDPAGRNPNPEGQTFEYVFELP